MSFNTLLKLKIKTTLFILLYVTGNSAFGQIDSLSLRAEQNFRIFMDSILTKEVRNDSYVLSNFSELKEKRAYPIEITSLVFPELYADRDEYYAAFLYREKYIDELNYNDLDSKITKYYVKLKKIILKGISRRKHYAKKENKLIMRLQQRIENSSPPLTGYIQSARIDYDFEGKSTSTWFEIHYNILLQVENFGRK